MRYRRATVRALVVSLFFAVDYGWTISPGASMGERVVTGVILFVVLFALGLIIDVGGALLAHERAHTRRTPPIDRP
jgi:hypothetical protein